MLRNKNIFIVSNEPWGKTWYSKHNYAWELSVDNKVCFINPATPFSIFNIFNSEIEIHEIKENLSLITYKNILPVRFEFLRSINEWYVFRKLNKFIRKKELKELIFWTFDPVRLSDPKKLNPKLIILHMVDKYLFTTKAEYLIARNADIVLCVAQEIATAYYSLNKYVSILPHAIPEDEFLPVKKENNQQLSAVYVGNIDVRIDFEFQKFIIEKFPNVTFEFVGKLITENVDTYEIFDGKYKNVVLHGEQPFKSLKYFIQKADFCFIFKDNNHPGNNISSHKMLQYFAQGKPIFMTKMSRYEEVKDILYKENDMQKMAILIENYIRNGEAKELSAKRIAYAKQYSFQNIKRQIEKIIDEK